jgi:hypothetical protein
LLLLLSFELCCFILLFIRYFWFIILLKLFQCFTVCIIVIGQCFWLIFAFVLFNCQPIFDFQLQFTEHLNKVISVQWITDDLVCIL